MRPGAVPERPFCRPNVGLRRKDKRMASSKPQGERTRWSRLQGQDSVLRQAEAEELHSSFANGILWQEEQKLLRGRRRRGGADFITLTFVPLFFHRPPTVCRHPIPTGPCANWALCVYSDVGTCVLPLVAIKRDGLHTELCAG